MAGNDAPIACGDASSAVARALQPRTSVESRDSIDDVWGARTPHVTRWPVRVDERTVDLSPGMAVTVEVKTVERTILSYLLSPLMKYSQESLRER